MDVGEGETEIIFPSIATCGLDGAFSAEPNSQKGLIQNDVSAASCLPPKKNPFVSFSLTLKKIQFYLLGFQIDTHLVAYNE